MRSVVTVIRHTPMAHFAGRDLTGRQVCAFACLAMVVVVLTDVMLTAQLGVFFGVCFVLVSVSAALAADTRSLYTPGVLPPLLLIVILTLVTLLAPHVIDAHGLADTAGSIQRVIAGITEHATALVTGHVLALLTIAYRIVTADD